MERAQPLDVCTLGSTMIRLTTPVGHRLETTPVLEVRTAGSESNVMAALARLGRRTGWVSRLTANPLGRRIANEIRYHGVDVSRVVWTAEDRNEVFFVEHGLKPRPTRVIYDRHPSAVARIRPEELDLDYLLNTRILHLTGIFPALSENTSEVAAELVQKAKRSGIPISFDVNYRAKLWAPEKAAKRLLPLARAAEIVIMTLEDAAHLFGLGGSPERAAQEGWSLFEGRVCVVTAGEAGAAAFDGQQHFQTPGHPVEIRDRLGGGDSFAAGLLHGYLDGSLQRGLEYGSAMAALKLSQDGDYLVSDLEEIRALLKTDPDREVGR